MKRILTAMLVLSCLFLSACNNGQTGGSAGEAENPTNAILTYESDKEVKRPVRMIKVDGKLYYDTGKVSDLTARCGTLDGELRQVGKEHEIPKNDNECNFDGAEGYQNVTGITKEVPIEGKWVIFKLFDDPEQDMSVFDYCFYLKGLWPNGKNQTELVVLTEDINYDIQDYFDLSKSYVGPDYGKYKTTFVYCGEGDEWGISLSSEDVTGKGLTLLCEQFGGSPTGEIQTGAAFSIEVSGDDGWQPVDETKDNVAWNSIAYMIKKNDITELKINWEMLYGELPAGQYKLKKEFMDFRAAGDFDEKMYEMYFMIRG